MTLLDPIPSPDPLIWTAPLVKQFFLILFGTLVETLAFQTSILIFTWAVLGIVDRFRIWRHGRYTHSETRQQFTLSLVPLSLFYSSLTKYFLLFLLTIWPPSLGSESSGSALSPSWPRALFPNSPSIDTVFHALDDNRLDKEWLVRNVVGGMSAGFGLRGACGGTASPLQLLTSFEVVLDDVPPLFTTAIVVGGWAVKTFVSHAVGQQIGDITAQQAWRTYSVP